MKLKNVYLDNKSLKISFEVFPPKEVEQYENLYEELSVLKKYNPAFVSLTWGAGGNNNSSTQLINRIKNLGFDIMPHFTCVCSTREFVKEHLLTLKSMNIESILALRGDLPNDGSQRCYDFEYASDLVQFIKAESDLSVGVAGYPEGHIESGSLDEDIKNLKFKVELGADAIFTQLFFSNDKFYKYVDSVRSEGVSVPVIPGIMPILSVKQIDRMTSLARISIPKNLADNIEKYGKSNSDMQKMGVEFAYNQCEDLIKNGVLGLHFYTLNKSKSVSEILDNIIGRK